MSQLVDDDRAWGQNMLREFAAKQQLVPLSHMFSDTIATRDLQQLRALAEAIRAIASGACDGDALRRLLRFHGDRAEASALLRAATAELDAEQSGFALALAYLPFEPVDAFAVNVLGGATLKRLAEAIDPRTVLPQRTRLFVADSLRRDATLRGLVAATASIAALRDNSAQADHAELCAPAARERLRRLGAVTAGYLADKFAFAAVLRSCRAQDWPRAQAQALAIAAAAGVVTGDTFSDPPALADLLLISLLPSCDTIDAVMRLTAAARNSTSRACAACD